MSEVSAATRRLVAARAGHQCEYCRCPEAFSVSSFCVEHITPTSRGGGSAPGNLAFACTGCNARKSDRLTATDPLSGAAARLFHPREQRWEQHFTWSRSLLEVVGLTKTGRATLAALQLNRGNLRNLRRLLLRDGRHPPSAEP